PDPSNLSYLNLPNRQILSVGPLRNTLHSFNKKWFYEQYESNVLYWWKQLNHVTVIDETFYGLVIVDFKRECVLIPTINTYIPTHEYLYIIQGLFRISMLNIWIRRLHALERKKLSDFCMNPNENTFQQLIDILPSKYKSYIT